MTRDLLFALIFLAAAALAVRSTWRLWRRHRASTPPRNRITRAFVVVAFIVTVFAGLIGLLSVRGAFGFTPLDFARPLALLALAAVLLIPWYLDRTAERIERGRP
jgi:protein-S-isoprenylcysteine O-methyltransferase Ste14